MTKYQIHNLNLEDKFKHTRTYLCTDKLTKREIFEILKKENILAENAKMSMLHVNLSDKLIVLVYAKIPALGELKLFCKFILEK